MSADKLQLLSDLGRLRTGYQLRGPARWQDEGRFLLVQLRDVQQGTLDMGNLLRMDLERAGKQDCLEPGDVLLRSRGASYGAAAVVECVEPMVAVAPLYVFRPDPSRVLPGYLVWFINHPGTQALLAGQARGTHIPTVSVQAFSELAIPLPSLAEQRRVVEIDRLMRKEREILAALVERRERMVREALFRLVRGED